MPRKSSHREYLRRLVDDEAEGLASLFASTDEESTSFTNDELLDSDASSEPDDLYSCNGPAAVANEEAGAVDVAQISTKQGKILKSFNVPGFPQYPGSSWSLTVSKISRDIALPTLDTVFNFIVTFCNRGGLSTEVGSRAHRLHLQGVFQTFFQQCLMLAKCQLCLSSLLSLTTEKAIE